MTITLNEKEIQTLVAYVGGVRYATAFLNETLQEEPALQKLDEALEEFLNDKGVFI